MTDEQKKLIEQFEKLKEKAKNKVKDFVKELPDCVDIHYFLSLSAMYQLRRLSSFSEDDVKAHLIQLRNKYTTDKGTYLRWQKIEQEALKKRMRASEILTKLRKTADTVTKTELYELFIKLIASAFDEVSAKQIQEKLSRRNDIQAVFESLTENAVYDLLNSYCHVPYKLAFAIIEEAKQNGEGHGGSYKVTYEGEKFNLYRIPGVILC